MKATGIVRRIDDLGRIIIPKEVRRTLRIHEGDPFELYTEGNDTVCIKKYQPIEEKDWKLAGNVLRDIISCSWAVFDRYGNGQVGDPAISCCRFDELFEKGCYKICEIRNKEDTLAFLVYDHKDRDTAEVVIAEKVLTTLLSEID